jgi:short-subunit dehydrogenase
MKKIAIVTGATSGIGLQITKLLLNENYKIYAIGRDFSNLNDNKNITKLELDLTNLKLVESTFIKLAKETDINLLVNCAGFGIFCQHEDIKINQIENMTTVNLTVPMIITKIFLKSIKKTKGTIVNISSIESTRHSKFSALYSATKSGLRAFSLSLFEEVRKDDVKVVVLNPDMTKTDFFDNLTFEPSEDKNSYITLYDIEKIFYMIINMEANYCLSELVIRPQKVGIKKKKIVKQ